MLRETLGILMMVFGALITLVSFALWCKEVSRDQISQTKAKLNPNSFEDIIVGIGKFVDNITSQPLFMTSHASRYTRTPVHKDEVLNNVHLELGRSESVLIRPGFIVTIDLAHRLHPVFRFMANPIVPYAGMLGLMFVIGGLGILSSIKLIDANIILVVGITGMCCFTVISIMYERKNSLFYILKHYWFRAYVTIEIDCLSVRYPNQFKPNWFKVIKTTPSLSFIVLDRGDVMGVALVDSEMATHEVFVFHHEMASDDLSRDSLPSFVAKLNKCLDEARSKSLV